MLQINHLKIFLIGLIINCTAAFAQATDNVSIVDLNKAQELFSAVYNNSSIPFNYPDGCYAKAQKISLYLDEKGIATGKSFIEGQIFYKSSWGESFWLFHVAPFILVNQNGQLQKMIIDPFLADHLLAYDDWVALIKKDSRTKINDSYDTNRFIYDPSVKFMPLTDYAPEFIYDMNVVLRQIFKRLGRSCENQVCN